MNPFVQAIFGGLAAMLVGGVWNIVFQLDEMNNRETNNRATPAKED